MRNKKEAIPLRPPTPQDVFKPPVQELDPHQKLDLLTHGSYGEIRYGLEGKYIPPGFRYYSGRDAAQIPKGKITGSEQTRPKIMESEE